MTSHCLLLPLSCQSTHACLPYICLLFWDFSDVYHSACAWPTALKLGCVTNLHMMGFISLIDEIQFMLISSRHICVRFMESAKKRKSEPNSANLWSRWVLVSSGVVHRPLCCSSSSGWRDIEPSVLCQRMVPSTRLHPTVDILWLSGRFLLLVRRSGGWT